MNTYDMMRNAPHALSVCSTIEPMKTQELVCYERDRKGNLKKVAKKPCIKKTKNYVQKNKAQIIKARGSVVS
jgi:hypothetical protein